MNTLIRYRLVGMDGMVGDEQTMPVVCPVPDKKSATILVSLTLDVPWLDVLVTSFNESA